MTSRGWLILGALLAATAVGLGAYHAHGLEQRLVTENVPPADLPKRMADFATGVRYQMDHAIGLILVGLLMARRPARALAIAGAAFLLGILLFSGGLYLLAFSGQQLHVLLIPIGGASFILGWIAVACGAWQQQE